jgi:hypothetical protein
MDDEPEDTFYGTATSPSPSPPRRSPPPRPPEKLPYEKSEEESKAAAQKEI